ncbi:MAG: type I glyceraldehyde-3-phosphate dehydrogenase [Bacteroidetes bacterium]|nr:type I glyceraldehyde-3-phosphate dehydrogenase [Bacteroidota bacterium]
MHKPRIAINGLGRIGRLALRILFEHDEIEIVGVNDLAPNDQLAYLLKYDTAQRVWGRSVSGDEKHILIDGTTIPCHAEPDPEKLDWKALNVDIVLECSGFFTTPELAGKHLKAGAGKVLISAPGKGDVKTIVLGVNETSINTEDLILSNASCTTNCLAPMVRILNDLCGIEDAMMSTIHAYTSSQKIQDSIHKKDWRRGRAAAMNIVPTTSGATKTLIKVMPEMEGKLQGGAVRVPVITGSLTELYCNVANAADVETINAAFKKESGDRLKGILEYTEDAVVSWDIVNNPHSCVFDSDLTRVHGKHVKLVGWYDNEFGYANRLVELALYVAKLK